MLVLDVKRGLVGGFKPVTWWSRLKIADGNNRFKGDESLARVLFTLTNPHQLPVSKLPLTQEHKYHPIFCMASRGPRFGIAVTTYGDLAIRDMRNESRKSSTAMGVSYGNDTGVRWRVVFTGAECSTVKGTELFKFTRDTSGFVMRQETRCDSRQMESSANGMDR
jgi:hypothetical protein